MSKFTNHSNTMFPMQEQLASFNVTDHVGSILGLLLEGLPLTKAYRSATRDCAIRKVHHQTEGN